MNGETGSWVEWLTAVPMLIKCAGVSPDAGRQ